MSKSVGAEGSEAYRGHIPVRRVLINTFEGLRPIVCHIQGDGIGQEFGEEVHIPHSLKSILLCTVHKFLKTQNIHVGGGTCFCLYGHEFGEGEGRDSCQYPCNNALYSRVGYKEYKSKDGEYQNDYPCCQIGISHLFRATEKILFSDQFSVERFFQRRQVGIEFVLQG